MDMLTNKVDVKLNYDQINKDFYVYQITADSLKDEQYKYVVNAIYEKIKPLSLVKPSTSFGKFLVLCNKDLDIRESHPNFTVQQVYTLTDLYERDIARLLIQAIPLLKHKQRELLSAATTQSGLSKTEDLEPIASEGVGLYYFKDKDKIHNAIVFRTFEIDIAPHTFDPVQSVIKINGTTFTPRELHKNSDGSYPAKILRQPSFNVTPFFEHIKKGQSKAATSRDHDYIKRGVKFGNKQSRMTSEMIVVDSSKPEKFFKSKAGVLSQFQHDINLLLSPYMHLTWLALPQSYRRHATKTDVDKHYDKIHQLLAAQQVYVCDIDSGNPDYANQVVQYLGKKGINASVRQDNLLPFKPEDEASNQPIHLILHHDADYYQDNKITDPYKQFTQAVKDRWLLKQSLTIESLFTDKDKFNIHMLDNSLTELLIKMEVAMGKLILSSPLSHNWRCIQGVYEDSENGRKKILIGYDVLDYKTVNNQISHQSYEDIDREALDIEELVTTFLGNDAKLGINDYLIICNPESDNVAYIIEESNCLPIPKFMQVDKIMRQLHKAQEYGFEISWAKEYLDLIKSGVVDIKLNKKPNLLDKLSKLVESNLNQNRIAYKQFKQAKIGYRSIDEQSFFNWVYDTHGYLFNTSLRGGQEGYLDAARGLFYSDESQTYFSGSTTNLNTSIANFNVMRRIKSDIPLNETPEHLLALMDTYHIRHRQSTVLPFLFKHLREFVRIKGHVE